MRRTDNVAKSIYDAAWGDIISTVPTIKNKRFRNADGKITMRLKQLAAETKEEAANYYKEGALYIHQGIVYKLAVYGTASCLSSREGNRDVVFNTEMLGTFLPDIASDGMEIIAVLDPKNKIYFSFSTKEDV